jgi:hypothetical protein
MSVAWSARAIDGANESNPTAAINVGMTLKRFRMDCVVAKTCLLASPNPAHQTTEKFWSSTVEIRVLPRGVALGAIQSDEEEDPGQEHRHQQPDDDMAKCADSPRENEIECVGLHARICQRIIA